MPHSLYLGSGLVQSRLCHFDQQAENQTAQTEGRPSIDEETDNFRKYQPSLAAIRSCLSYSVIEPTVCLFTFALFINSAILIVAGAALSDTAASQTADLFGIHDLLSTSLAPVAGTLFA